MRNNLIIYETYYGTAKRVANIFSLILGNAKVLDINDGINNMYAYENIILVFAFHGYKTAEKIKQCINENKQEFKEKNIALIGVGLSKRDLDNYSKEICSVLEKSADIIEFVQGELRINKLVQEDKIILKKFLEEQNIKLMDMGKFKVNDACNIAYKCRDFLMNPNFKLNKTDLKEIIDKFIKSHNTCTLATGYENFIRATPIEYIYFEDAFYFITEGGLKFNSILQNSNVSICIYESYTGMGNLKGLQISGVAKIIDIGSKEYKKIMKIKKIKEENLKNFHINLNMIRVDINKIEFLNSDFKKMGFDIKQVLKE